MQKLLEIRVKEIEMMAIDISIAKRGTEIEVVSI